MADITPDLRTLLIAHRGVRVAARTWRGASLERPTNIKSASKTIVATLIGIAAARGLFSLDDRIAPILGRLVPQGADPRVGKITIRHLLGMRADLQSTSGANYGRWVSSHDWLTFILSGPFTDEPGGQMIYSTGNSHILGVILARTSGQTLRDLTQAWLGTPLGFNVPGWSRDPQGYYFGGNDMAIAPDALLAFGECCRDMGRHGDREVSRRAFWRKRGGPLFAPHSAASFTGLVGGSARRRPNRWSSPGAMAAR